MEREAAKQAGRLPALSGQELADISRDLGSLAWAGSGGAKPK
jgi:hypothetical protein